MRLRLPLSLALGLCAVASCDQLPVDTADGAAATETAFLDAQPAATGAFTISGTLDLCGYDMADYEATVRYASRVVYDPTGSTKSHYIDNDAIHGWAVGQTTGERWRVNEAYNEQSQWYDAAAPDEWSVKYRVHWIGLGATPSFEYLYTFRYNINANGDLVMYWEAEEPLCP